MISIISSAALTPASIVLYIKFKAATLTFIFVTKGCPDTGDPIEAEVLHETHEGLAVLRRVVGTGVVGAVVVFAHRSRLTAGTGRRHPVVSRTARG